MNAARDIVRNVPGFIGCTCFREKPVLGIGETISKYYIRLKVADKPGVLASIALVFGNKEVSLKSVIQKEATGKTAELVLVTHRVQVQNVRDGIKYINRYLLSKQSYGTTEIYYRDLMAMCYIH